jgi:hypothetical protein
MAMTRKSFIISLALVLIIVAAIYGWRALPSARLWEEGYLKISEGDSEERVVEILGEPTKIKDCFASSFGKQETRQKCAKEYWYIAFLQEWVYVIDKDGKVVTKWHSVSQ